MKPRNSQESTDLLLPALMMGANLIETKEITRKHHNVFLDQPIDEPLNYRGLISLLFDAEEGDTFHMFINSEGGHLSSALAIIEAIKHTPAVVTGIIVGECHSAASLITMYCHEIAVLDSAHMMVHTANFGTVGSTGNVKAFTDFTVRQVENLLDDAYDGFLTPEELQKVKTGVELWFDSTEIKDRIQGRVKAVDAKLQASLEPVAEPKKPARKTAVKKV